MKLQGVHELASLVGQDLGRSGWFEVSQEKIDRFAEITGDNQWIHTDQERAKTGPFGSTIAHGFLVLSFASPVMRELLNTGGSRGINYGLDRVRFVEPVRAGQLIRGAVKVLSVSEEPDAWTQAKLEIILEVQGSDRPACVAEVIVRYYV